MSDFWFSSVSAGAITAASFFWCTLTALVLGALIALVSAVAGEERRKRLQTPPKGRSKRR